MRRINLCLNPQLSSICKQSMMIEKLNDMLKHFLPDTLKEHCFISSFNKGAMQITTSPPYATELRFMLPMLRDTFRKEAKLHSLSNIKLHILENFQTTKSAPKKVARISDKAKKLILDGVECIEDETLKNAMLGIIS